MEKILRIFEPLLALGRHLARAPLDLLCPPACAACRSQINHSSDVLCQKCWSWLQENLLSPACPVCGHNVGQYSLLEGRCHRCQHRRPVVQNVVRVGDYQNTLRELILAFKFHHQSHLDDFLGRLLSAAILGMPSLAGVDTLVPIPLHWRRRWTRRYNQADLLAFSAAKYLHQQGLSVNISFDLLRIRNTPPQTSLTTSERIINLRGAFAVRCDTPFNGKHICLVDDVSTTGTTLRVAAQTLHKAGARQISAAVLAVAAND